ncbi:hypothetical protein GGS23DRAFT_608320 [Durotheca rogersii]|uniref:uncharacterized protein n=1 Tax=Durotheca rogersii TaxID=419775 RepID=UPI00221EB421|nr:uncharacterized protein GGS23DRAFT_608320 [Durotheca rogersii]KAI5854086.1 hypothetical protein GGS23DRAFT_608320 [Durotheca rogersii]
MDTPGRSLTSLRSLTLDLPPSCIEFCPAHADYFIVGTYNLENPETPDAAAPPAPGDDEEPPRKEKRIQARNGSLVVFRLTGSADIRQIRTVSYPSAILDLHFHPRWAGGKVAAVVSSTGTLSFFHLSVSGEYSATLDEIATHRPLGDDEGVLILSCCWHPSIPELLAITTSNCQVHILRVDEHWDIHQTHDTPLMTHSLEAWTVAFSSFVEGHASKSAGEGEEEPQLFTIFSGGDDSKLLSASCAYQRVRGNIEGNTVRTRWPVAAIQGHEAGVTAILPLGLRLTDGGSLVVTGSYDDHIRVYSVPSPAQGASLQRPRVLAEQDLCGGVWRLKLVKLEQEGRGLGEKQQWTLLILASCMHAGPRVLEVVGDNTGYCRIDILGRFEEHQSMNYSSDFQPLPDEGGQRLRCISTSFYDRLLCLWEF